MPSPDVRVRPATEADLLAIDVIFSREIPSSQWRTLVQMGKVLHATSR